MRRYVRANHQARQRRLRAVLSKTGKMPVSDPEDDEADELDDLVACTLGWEGGAVPYSPGRARELYADSRLGWLRGCGRTHSRWCASHAV